MRWLLLQRWLWRSLPGCRKEAAPETQVTVQAEHPETGPIAEHVTADAVLQPVAQAAIGRKIARR